MEIGQRITYRFSTSGVYPYFCFFHPGMVGAVVVGDAAGLGAAGAVANSDSSMTNQSLASGQLTSKRANHTVGAVSTPPPQEPPRVLVMLAAASFGAVVGVAAGQVTRLAAGGRRRRLFGNEVLPTPARPPA
jgi:hypothetical protein